MRLKILWAKLRGLGLVTHRCVNRYWEIVYEIEWIYKIGSRMFFKDVLGSNVLAKNLKNVDYIYWPKNWEKL